MKASLIKIIDFKRIWWKPWTWFERWHRRQFWKRIHKAIKDGEKISIKFGKGKP